MQWLEKKASILVWRHMKTNRIVLHTTSHLTLLLPTRPPPPAPQPMLLHVQPYVRSSMRMQMSLSWWTPKRHSLQIRLESISLSQWKCKVRAAPPARLILSKISSLPQLFCWRHRCSMSQKISPRASSSKFCACASSPSRGLCSPRMRKERSICRMCMCNRVMTVNVKTAKCPMKLSRTCSKLETMQGITLWLETLLNFTMDRWISSMSSSRT